MKSGGNIKYIKKKHKKRSGKGKPKIKTLIKNSNG
jgi:hypothetical protein